jgi:hypothetical protein
MKRTSLSRPNEQRKIEALLTRLAKLKPISAQPAPIAKRDPNAANGIAISK